MELKIFQSEKGDCLLLESADHKLVLVDGGMTASMRTFVAPHLGALRAQGRELDAVYISHIDQDHISGVLELLENELSWRVFDHHVAAGDPIAQPTVPRPPRMRALWHNAFRDQVPANDKPIEKLFAAAVPTLLASRVPSLAQTALAMADIAQSVKEALQVSRLSAMDLLGIPINKIPGSKAKPRLLRADGKLKPFKIGSMTFTILGPTVAELTQLRDGWNHWLERSQIAVNKLREQMKKRADEIATGNPLDGIAAEWEGMPDFQKVTVPNIASLMFMVEENGKRLLLTGDTHHKMLSDGLQRAKFLDPQGRVHVDVLKVQHHGSEHNLDADFGRRVTADHYVFCGNGENGNPEQVVLERIFNARMTEANGKPFKFWFSTTSAVQRDGSKEKTVYAAVEQRVALMVQQSQGRLTTAFNQGDFITLSI